MEEVSPNNLTLQQEGVVLVQENVRLISNMNVIVRADIDQIKDKQVTLISGGGSGHEPSHAGFVGKGFEKSSLSVFDLFPNFFLFI